MLEHIFIFREDKQGRPEKPAMRITKFHKIKRIKARAQNAFQLSIRRISYFHGYK